MEFKVGDRVMAVGTLRAVSGGITHVLFDGAHDERSTEMFISELRPIDPNPIIGDPNIPEARALVGKTVLMGDYWNEVDLERVLKKIDTSEYYPFLTDSNKFRFIRAIPEKPIKKMTVSEVCKALGYDIEIVKEE